MIISSWISNHHQHDSALVTPLSSSPPAISSSRPPSLNASPKLPLWYKNKKTKKKNQNTYQKSSLQIRNCTKLSRRIEIETKSGKQLPDNNKIGRRVCRSPASLSLSLSFLLRCLCSKCQTLISRQKTLISDKP